MRAERVVMVKRICFHWPHIFTIEVIACAKRTGPDGRRKKEKTERWNRMIRSKTT